MTHCEEPGCTGTIMDDGYCDTCGTKASDVSKTPASQTTEPASTRSALTGSRGTLRTGSALARGRRRLTTGSTRTTSRPSDIGGELVEVPPVPPVDPNAVLLRDAVVSEDKRYCSNCGGQVGRRRGEQPGRLSGFCPNCRQPFDFVPKLQAGDVVAGQYRVAGCLAHGGLGWIYLARDTAVNDRWVVLKGLLNSGDEAAMTNAVVERQFLAELQHPNIVAIYNFVSHLGAGYIVMEYVGGRSLKQVLRDRREANGGKPDPMPVDQAIAFILEILPASSYLHGRGLVYCDFKPDNLVQVAEQLKLIDMGGVRRLADAGGDVYGTVGFQAPEIAELGPSVASDLYTIGRTLAVLTLDFRGYQNEFQYLLPAPADHPALARYDSFHRFLLKATAQHPDDRFQSADEMAGQLAGVLREVVALNTHKPQPVPSTLFSVPRVDGSLPTLVADADDPSSPFLSALTAADSADVLAEIDEATTAGRVHDTIEVQLRRVREWIELRDFARAAAQLDVIDAADPWEWRSVWLRGVGAYTVQDFSVAAQAFDRCRSEVPGEQAPKLAAALTAEAMQDFAGAESLYSVLTAVDPGNVAAVKGLARTKAAQGDVDGAVRACAVVPTTHRAWAETQVDAVRILTNAGRYDDATHVLRSLPIDDRRRASLQAEISSAAFASNQSGAGAHFEAALRHLAALTPDLSERYKLVDQANRVRPVTVV